MNTTIADDSMAPELDNEPEDNISAYVKEASQWSKDSFEHIKTQRNIAIGISIFMGVLAIICLLAVLALVPLKETKPFLIKVEESTGALEVITDLDNVKELTKDEAYAASMLNQYVIWRETYDFYDQAERFKWLARHTESNLFKAYEAYTSANNPASPYNELDDGERVEVDIKSILPVGDSRTYWAIRYKTTHKGRNGLAKAKPLHHVAYVNFEYLPDKVKMKDRIWNPYGFIVTSIRKDIERG